MSGQAQPSDGRRMVRRGMATYAVIDWDGDDEALPRSIKHITPGQANDPQYQRQQSGEIVLLVPRGRPTLKWSGARRGAAMRWRCISWQRRRARRTT